MVNSIGKVECNYKEPGRLAENQENLRKVNPWNNFVRDVFRLALSSLFETKLDQPLWLYFVMCDYAVGLVRMCPGKYCQRSKYMI